MKSRPQSWQPRTNAFCDFSNPCLWSIAPATKRWCQVVESAAPVTQNHLPKTEDLMLRHATPLRKLSPGPPNMFEHVWLMLLLSILRLPRKIHLSRSSSNVPRPPSFLEILENHRKPSSFAHYKVHNPLRRPRANDIWTSKSAPHPSAFCTFDLEMCFAPQRRALFRHLNFQKCSDVGVLCTFWLRNVLLPQRRPLLSTFPTSQLPKSAPTLVCLLHFDFEMCFAAQRRALFRHLNFQKWSGPGVFCTFWLRNVLRATTTCTFSTSQLPKVLRAWCAVYILTWKFASRHNGVQFFISHLARWLRTRRFSEPTFRPAGATNHWKNTVFPDVSTFSRTCIFFLLTLSLLWSSLFFSSLLFSSEKISLTLPTYAFPSVHIVGSLTSKLPSVVHTSTSSTAQGGGGSFKNRKPIGEIGCCESGMAERIHWWTESCLRSPLFLSLSLTIYLPTSLSSIYLSIYLSTYLSIYLSFFLSTYLSIYLSLSLSLICLSV